MTGEYCVKIDEAIREAVQSAITDSLKSVMVEKRLYSLPEAARYLGRSKEAIGRMVRQGHVQVTSHDSKILIDVLELDRYCERVRHYHEAAA